MWRPWSVRDVAALWSASAAPWWIAGGWAIDLWLGEQTREHGDIDVQLLRRDQHAIHAVLRDWDIHAARGGALEPWPIGTELDDRVHDLWCRPRSTEPWAIELMLADADASVWRYRRDPRVTRPLTEIGRATADGIPYLAPEIQLLYKAKTVRARDEADFARAAPALEPAQRRWLIDALALAHPGHSWLARL